MKNLIKSKLFIAGALSVFCVLILVVCIAVNRDKKVDFNPAPGPLVDAVENWTENKDNKTPSATVDDYVANVNYTPDDKTVVDANHERDIALTVIEDKPEPPELPETAFVWEQDEEVTPEDVEAYEALDPALKNPNVRPSITPTPIQSTPTPQTSGSTTQQSTPKNGDRRNGEVYVLGFGWVKDEGGGTQITQSQLDPNHADFDKIIGY